MSDVIDRELERCRQAGEAVALAVVVGGPGQQAGHGARLLVWRGGAALGDLGSPRLNQRVALYAEGLLERGGAERKRFDVSEGELEIETTIYSPEEADAR